MRAGPQLGVAKAARAPPCTLPILGRRFCLLTLRCYLKESFWLAFVVEMLVIVVMEFFLIDEVVNVGRGANIKKDPQRSAGQNRWVKKKITSLLELSFSGLLF